MQTLIYKTDIVVERAPAWLAPNAPVELRPQADGAVVAYAQRPSRLFTLFRSSRPVRIGVLHEEAGELLRPILDAGITIRVRIVELQPAHLAVDRRARISVSVWASVTRITPPSAFSRVGPA